MLSSRALQTYEGDQLTVTFDPRLCIHSKHWVHALPAVFDPTRKRWIRPDAGTADEVVAAVAGCPSGALRVRRPADDTEAVRSEAAVVTVSRDGPLLLRRCGATANPPVRDGATPG
jgi:uncharacterized Fe-S cluster protein YjdI